MFGIFTPGKNPLNSILPNVLGTASAVATPLFPKLGNALNGFANNGRQEGLLQNDVNNTFNAMDKLINGLGKIMMENVGNQLKQAKANSTKKAFTETGQSSISTNRDIQNMSVN